MVLRALIASLLAGACVSEPPEHDATRSIEAPSSYSQAACRALTEQIKAERLALKLLEVPEVKDARQYAADKWRAAVGPTSTEMEPLFDEALAE